MAAFDYQAVDSRGKNSRGVLEGDNAKQVRAMLREKGLIPLDVTPSLAKSKQQTRGGVSRGKISATELALITRQLATLVESGLPIEESLMAVAEQCEKNRLKSMMMSVRAKVNEGFTLAESMAEFPHVFDKLFRAMVAAGEKSGYLDKVLDRLADYTEQRQNMRSQIIQASIYPVIMTLVAVSVIVVLLVAVVPKIVGQFDHLGEQLPGTTQFLIAVSNFLQNYVLWIVAAIILAIIIFKQMMKGDAFRMKVHEASLSMPITGKVSKGLNTARFARTLSILTASSVPLLESMRIAGEVLTNDFIQLRVSEAADKVREGASLQASLKQTKLFPPMMVHMIASGEKSGELESMLSRAADNQDRQFEALVNISLKIFEPALMVTMGVIVLFIVMAIVQPILQLNTMI